MAKRIFKDAAHQAQFDEQGYIVLPFVSEEKINELNELFDSLHPNLHQGGFFSGSFSSDFEYKKKASDAIVAAFSDTYERLFLDYTPFGGAFLYKVPGENSALAAHQDWTIVDEEKQVALNCWVPLCDVTKENGTLHVVPGSHYDKIKTLRAPTLPFYWHGNEEEIMAQLIPIEVKAGMAVILNQSVIHYSSPNRSQAVRKAITAGVKSAGAQLYFHYKIPDKNELEVFEMDDDFLLRFDDFMNDIGQRPKLGKSLGYIPYTAIEFKENNIDRPIVVEENKETKPTNWLQTILQRFGF